MKKTLLLGLLMQLLVCWQASAQWKTDDIFVAKDLIGTNISPSLWNEISNGAEVVLIDFWSTWCHSCVMAMPKMEALQAAFPKEKFRLIAVNASETKLDTEKRLMQFKDNIRIPAALAVYKDEGPVSTLSSLFKRQSIPHHVWLRKGEIIAITNGTYATPENVQKALSNEPFNLPVKDDLIGFNWLKDPLEKKAHPALKDKLYGSTLTPAHPGLVQGRRSSEDSTRDTYANMSVVELYQIAYGYELYNNEYRGRTVIDLPVQEKERFTRPDYAGPDMFCYEVTVSQQCQNLKAAFMQQDLNRYFTALYNITSYLDTMTLEAVVLVKKDYKGQLITKKEGVPRHDYDNAQKIHTWINMPFSSMVRQLTQEVYDSLPFVDATGFAEEYRVDFIVHGEYNPSFFQLKTSLNKYGLDLVLQRRKFEVLRIRRYKSKSF